MPEILKLYSWATAKYSEHSSWTRNSFKCRIWTRNYFRNN